MSCRFLALVMLLLLGACGQQKTLPNAFPVPAQLTLYSIQEDRDINNDWAEKANKLEDFPLLGKLEVASPETRQEIMEAINQGVAESRGSAACFNPRHGIRAIDGQHQTDYIICFECSLMYVLSNGKRTAHAISNSPQATLNKILVDAGVPLNIPRK